MSIKGVRTAYTAYIAVLYTAYFTQYPFYAHQRWSSRGHGLSLEDPRGQLTMSLVLALDCQSLALASDCQSLALASNYQALALEDVIIGLEHSDFPATNPAPASILTSVRKYIDFIPEQSCSDGSVASWKAAVSYTHLTLPTKRIV